MSPNQMVGVATTAKLAMSDAIESGLHLSIARFTNAMAVNAKYAGWNGRSFLSVPKTDHLIRYPACPGARPSIFSTFTPFAVTGASANPIALGVRLTCSIIDSAL
jgi:hypothetical protein